MHIQIRNIDNLQTLTKFAKLIIKATCKVTPVLIITVLKSNYSDELAISRCVPY